MKAKLVSFIKSLILKDGNKVSMSKALAWITGLCATIVLSQGVLIANGVVIPPELIPVFKWAGVITGIYSIIKTRDSKPAGYTTTPAPENK